ncbi:MAG: acetyl-CoA C-acetyltransferase [Oscillospiraceae bacterium]|nr:acetyl-CoA C-acetyltransferase [Oscillospiraceae bacterium]
MRDIYLISCCRTAIGNFGGTLKDTSAVELGTIVAKAALDRAGIPLPQEDEPSRLDEIMFGCVLTTGLGQNVARQVAVNAEIPKAVPAYTINMVCGSGMKSVVEGARSIAMGDAEIILAGGCENMSQAPYSVPTARSGARLFNTEMVDTLVHDGLTDAFNHYHMGVTAENVCDAWNITREELDAFALSSQQKALAAIASGKFVEEIVPVPVKVKRETIEFKTDEFPRESTMEGLAKLPAVFMDGGRVTPGNASGLNDGAAAIVLASGDAVKKYGLTPIARLVSWGQAGVCPTLMGIGPVPAAEMALEKAGLTVADIDLVEANEAFASQAIAVARKLGLDMQKVNVNGGAIALGHPIGASGSRVIVTLIHEMKRRNAKRGLATLCIGGGMGIASVWELV